MASVYKRGSVWWIKVSTAGKIIQRSAGPGASRQDAKALATSLEAKANRGLFEPGRRVRVAELLDLVLQDYRLHGRASLADAERRISKHLEPALGHVPAGPLSDLTGYVQDRLEAGARPGTINRELAIVSKAYRLGQERGLVDRRPVIRLLSEADGIRQGVLRPEEFARLLEAISDEHLRLFVRWLGTTGMRSGEAKQLTWAMVHGDELRVPAPAAKNRRDRVLPLAGPLSSIIQEARSRRRLDCPTVFHRHGRPIGAIRKTWARACQKAGLEGLIPHDLRRSAVTSLFRAGIPEHLILAISGHQTSSILRRYNIADREDTARALEKLGEYLDRGKKAI